MPFCCFYWFGPLSWVTSAMHSRMNNAFFLILKVYLSSSSVHLSQVIYSFNFTWPPIFFEEISSFRDHKIFSFILVINNQLQVNKDTSIHMGNFRPELWRNVIAYYMINICPKVFNINITTFYGRSSLWYNCKLAGGVK